MIPPTRILAAFALTLRAMSAAEPPVPGIDLRECLMPSPVRDVSQDSILISGKATSEDGQSIRVRVTTSLGTSAETTAAVHQHHFTCTYPQDFPHSPALVPSLLYVDATTAATFGGKECLQTQAEMLLIVSGKGKDTPDLPMIFTDDFVDAQGHKHKQSAQWRRNRALVNLFVQSRSARLMHIGRSDFDLDKAADFQWFQNHATLYDFDHRDRDWSEPLGHRVARGYWQAVWNTWFNASNDHPWDGNAANRTQQNYRPYTFANDAADLLVMYQMQRHTQPIIADNRAALADEVLANLLAMQHRAPDNFALKESSGKQEHYTAGAFRYGMFETGEWMTEGTGWFADPQFRDFVRGGVFNGRSVWALGESLKADPTGALAHQVRAAIALALRFCLHDGIEHQYTKLTPSGLPVWGGSAGEHAYLLLGMLAAAKAEPDMQVTLADSTPSKSLSSLCFDALNALVEIAEPAGNWSRYSNANAINIAALAEGVRTFPTANDAVKWKAAATRAADLWLALKPLPEERTQPTPMFGHLQLPDKQSMTFHLGKDGNAHVSLYIGGHWLHALAVLYTVTHDERYAARANAVLAYYCGDNPLHVRLLNELGAVNNRLSDIDGDGIEDQIGWDGYPESTAFMQIGLLHLLAW